MRGARAWLVGIAILVVAVAAILAVGAPGAPAGSKPGSSPLPVESAANAGAPTDSSLPTIARADLPAEARTTLDRIAAGGPFPYDADGSVYQNRERILPLRPAGSYREYTVDTPGSPDRGARRIVVAATGEAYWTADHYASFARIVP
jgi:ribonuclease T1